MTVRYFRKLAITAVVRFDGSNYDEVWEFTGHDWFRPAQAERRAEFVAEVYDHLHDTWVGVAAPSYVASGGSGEYYPIAAVVLDNAERYQETDEHGVPL